MKTRKLLTAVIAFLAFVVTTLAQTVPSYVPTNGLVGYWGFNGNANDQSGNGNNGIVNGATLTTDRNGNANSAYSFDGVSNYIQTQSTFSLITGTSSRTVSFWLKSNGNSSGRQSAVMWGTQVGCYGKFNVNISATSGSSISLITGCGIYDNPAMVLDNNWHNIICVFDSSLGLNTATARYYLDGVLLNYNGSGSNLTNNIFTQSSPVIFGNDGGSDILRGVLDDVAIYNRALTQTEISQLYYSNPVQNLCTKTTKPYNVNVGDTTHDGSTYAWSISPTTPSAVITGNGTNAITIDWTNAPNGTYTLQAIETSVDGCVSAAVSAAINLYGTPEPLGITNQTLIPDSTLSNIVVTGQNIQWYSTPFGNTPLSNSTPLENGITYYASQTIDGCESTDRLPVTVQITLNNDQFDTINIVYYPNPVIDILTIKASIELKNAKIYNVLGQPIFQQRFNSNEIQLNISNVPTGTYFVIVESDERKETFKILKK